MTSSQARQRPTECKQQRGGPGDNRRIREAVERGKSGDMEALHFLYVRFSSDVLNYVKSFVKDHHEAEDITQNVFLKLTKALKKYEAREVPFAAWILRVARNAALDHLRARRSLPCEEVRVGTTTRPGSATSAVAICARRWGSCRRTSAKS